MKKTKTVSDYFEKETPFRNGILLLRELVLESGMEETLKWGAPVYTIGGKNVVGIMAFKSHFGLWFFNGAFLSDPEKVLDAAQESTKAMRHWRMHSESDINPPLIAQYLQEAISNQKEGKVLQPTQAKKTEIPELLQGMLDNSPELKACFEAFTPYKQREFFEYISSAKREQTKLTRLEKIIPMILKGIGLHDAYRK